MKIKWVADMIDGMGAGMNLDEILRSIPNICLCTMGDRREEGFGEDFILCIRSVSTFLSFTHSTAFPIVCRARTGAWVCLS